MKKIVVFSILLVSLFITSCSNKVIDNSKYENSSATFLSEALHNGGGMKMTEGWHCNSKNNNPFDDVTNSWYIPNDQYLYFSDISNGFVRTEPFIIEDFVMCQYLSYSGLVEPGDIVFFLKKGEETMYFSAMITGIDENGFYCTGESKDVVLHNSLLDESFFEQNDAYFLHIGSY